MLFNVPQFIDVEDKVAGPLTAKQVLWLIGMGAVLFIVWTVFDTPTFLVLSIPIILIFSLFAFYRPYNQPFLTFVTHGAMFLFRPKVYTWDRTGMGSKAQEPAPVQKEDASSGVAKPLSIEEIRNLAEIVDVKK